MSNSVRNGAIVGAIGAGAVFGVVAWQSCEDTACVVGVPLIWAGIGAGCGALVGLAIDRAKKTDSARSQQRLSAMVASVLAPSTKGLRVVLQW